MHTRMYAHVGKLQTIRTYGRESWKTGKVGLLQVVGKTFMRRPPQVNFLNRPEVEMWRREDGTGDAEKRPNKTLRTQYTENR